MSEQVSRRNLARQRAKDYFAGRVHELEAFRKNLELDYSHQERKLIWMVTGEGGVGKTTLLRQFRVIVKQNRYVTAWLDGSDQSDIVAAMGAYASQLEARGYSMKPFIDRYNTFRQINREIEADPERPKGLATALGQAAGHIGVAAMKQVPVAGDVTVALLGDEWMVDKTSEFAAYIARKITHKDDTRLIKEPIDVLTPLFVEALNETAKKTCICIFLDTYEKASVYLDNWLCDVLEGEKYGELSLEVMLVLAGRYELGQCWVNEFIEPFVSQIHLRPFTDAEARDYLARRKITDEASIKLILKLSSRVPVLLTTLASKIPNDPNALGDPTDLAIHRFLKWVQEEAKRQAILTCSLPRALNLDIVNLLLGSEQAQALFEFIKEMSFVRQTVGQGWIYHDVVRELMIRYRRQESRRQWEEIHISLVEYYTEERDRLNLAFWEGILDEEWKRFDFNWLYHTICAHGRGAIIHWVTRILEGYDYEAPVSYFYGTGVIVQEAGHVLEEVDIITWGQATLDAACGLRNGNNELILPLLNEIVALGALLENRHRSLALRWRSLVHRDLGYYTRALEDYNQAIDLDCKNYRNYQGRGKVHRALGNYPTALKDFTKSIEFNHEDYESFQGRGWVYRALGNRTAALEDFSRAIELQPDSGNSYLGRAFTYGELGKLTEAFADFFQALMSFKRAIKLQPDNGYSFEGLGWAYFALGNRIAALEDFTKAIEIMPMVGSFYHGRGITQTELGNYSVAMEDFSIAIQRMPQVGGFYWARGQLHYGLGNFPLALRDFQRSVELHPENGDHYSWQGWLHLLLGHLCLALDDYSKAIELQPKKGRNYFGRAIVELQLEKYSDAVIDLETAYKYDFEYFLPAILVWCGVARHKQGLLDEAKETWKMAENKTYTVNNICLQLDFLGQLAVLRNYPIQAGEYYTKILQTDCKKNLIDLRGTLTWLILLSKILPERNDIRKLRLWFESEIENQ